MRLTLYRAHGTSKASFFMFIQRQTVGMRASGDLGTWIPKSCFTVISTAPDRAWQWNKCELEVKDWFVSRNALVMRQKHAELHHARKSEAPALRAVDGQGAQ